MCGQTDLKLWGQFYFSREWGFVMKSCCHRGGGSCVGQFRSKTDWCWLLTVPYVFRDIKTVRKNIYNWNLNEVKLIHFVEESPWRRAFLWEIIVVSVNAWKGSKYVVFLVPIFLYSVRIQENTDQKKLRIWHFSRSQLNKLKGESSKRKQVKKLLFLVASVFLPF